MALWKLLISLLFIFSPFVEEFVEVEAEAEAEVVF